LEKRLKSAKRIRKEALCKVARKGNTQTAPRREFEGKKKRKKRKSYLEPRETNAPAKKPT